MPLYEYLCNGCQRTVEVIQKFSDPDLKTCEVCGGDLEKLLSAPAIHFKGSGWYITDYARKNGSGPGTGPNSGTSSSATSETASTESSAPSEPKAEKKSTEKKTSEKKSSSSSPKVA